MNLLKITVVTTVSLAVGHANAYSTRTHQEITRLALTQCVGRSETSYATLPLPSFSQSEKGFLTDRKTGAGIPASVVEGTTTSAVNFVRIGAVLEDRGARVLNHFFDPVFDRGFSPLNIPFGYKSPNWALEDGGEAIFQDFSFHELKRLYAQSFNPFQRTNPNLNKSQADPLNAQISRLSGQVAHHLQDMAQPQHARNDNHFENMDFDNTPLERLNARRSTYEKFVDKLTETDKLSLLSPCSYPDVIEAFIDPDSRKGVNTRRLWTGNGKGIADYSNRGFVSENTNFNSIFGATYPSPTLVDINPLVVPVDQLCAEAAAYDVCEDNLIGSAIFYGNTVEDKLFPQRSAYNPRMTSISAFTNDPDLISNIVGTKDFVQNRWTHFEAAKLLIPRAISYSRALMVDYKDQFLFRTHVFDVEAIQGGSKDVRVHNTSLDTMSGKFYFPRYAAEWPPTYDMFELELSPGAKSNWLRLSYLPNNFAYFMGDWGEAKGRDGVFGIVSPVYAIKVNGLQLGMFAFDDTEGEPAQPSNCVSSGSAFAATIFPTPDGCTYAVPAGYDARYELSLIPPAGLGYIQHIVDGVIKLYSNGEVVDELRVPDFASIASLGSKLGNKIFQLAPGVLAAAQDGGDGNGRWGMLILFQDPVRRAKWTCETTVSCLNFEPPQAVYFPD